MSNNPAPRRKPAPRLRAAAGLVAASLAALTAFSSTSAVAAPAEGQVRYATSDRAVAGSYIVVLKDGSVLDQASAATLTARYGGRVNRLYGKVVHGYAANLSDSAARRLAADPAVSYVEQDQVLRADAAQATGSGTSFAAPHVAGGAALYLAAHPSAAPATVNSAVMAASTTGVVTSGGSGSPNRLLYTATLGS